MTPIIVTNSSPAGIVKRVKAPAPAAGASPFFEETFETGTFSGGPAGSTGPEFAWEIGDDGDTFISSTDPISGVYSFVNRYPATSTESNSEKEFWLGRDVGQLWLEYEWLVPTNFVHASFEITNQIKMFAFWRDSYGAGTPGPKWVSEIRRTSDTESWFRAMGTRGDASFVAGLEDYGGIYHLPTGSRFISATGPVTRGVKTTLRFNFKPSSSAVATDGHWKMWVDGVPFFTYTGPLYSTNVATVTTPEVRRGYLMGYSNSGFAAVTDFKTDNIKFYDTDPGW
jgi:hypothetical protein